MKTLARLLCIVPLLIAAPAQASEDAAFTHALNLVRMFVRAAASSDDPAAGLKVLDDVLAGRNTEANRALAGLLEEATSDMSAQHKEQVAAIGRDLASMARKQVGRVPGTALVLPATASAADAALQARKDLTAIGLRYYDTEQFLDAVKRDDKLAVELFIIARGIDPAVISRSLPQGR